VFRNKDRLVSKEYSQEKGKDHDETYASVAKLETIRMLLAFACHTSFKLHQKNVKNAFSNGHINEEVTQTHQRTILFKPSP